MIGKDAIYIFVILAILIYSQFYYLFSAQLSAELFFDKDVDQPETNHDNEANSSSSEAAAVVDRSLPALVKPSAAPSLCPEHTHPIEQVHDREADEGKGRRIPRIVHVTGKTRCLTKAFYDNVNKWKFENHSFYFHDDEAVDRLIYGRDWPLFPELKNTVECLRFAGGAAKADLWRLLVLWEYGGIYTDMDNEPGFRFGNGSAITPDTDAFFLQERGGFPSQYFFAASPRHPLMYLAIKYLMKNVLGLKDIGGFYVPRITGPEVVKIAFLLFMEYNTDDPPEVREKMYAMYAKPKAGTYTGVYDPNHNVTVAGKRMTTNDWVRRSGVGGKSKNDGFKLMNITNYQHVNKAKKNISCDKFLYQLYH